MDKFYKPVMGASIFFLIMSIATISNVSAESKFGKFMDAVGEMNKAHGGEEEHKKSAYDNHGYDPQGFDRQGFDRQGYNRQGRNRQGYSRRHSSHH